MNEKMIQTLDFWNSFGEIFPASVLVITKTGKIVHQNSVFKDLVNLKVNNLFHFMDNDCLKKINTIISASEKEKKIIPGTFKIRKSTEEMFYFICYVYQLSENNFALILVDNTEINNKTLMLDNIINTVPDPIFVKDDQFRFLYINQACAKTWGLPTSEILGKNNDAFFPKEETDVFNKIDVKTFRTGKTTTNEEKFTRIQGNTRIISTKKSIFKTLTGCKVLVGVSHDVTEINKARECLKKHAKELKRQVDSRTKQLKIKTKDLEKAVEKLQSLNSDLDCFAHICCHELREPLRAINSYSKILLDEYSDGTLDNIGNFLHVIHQGSLRMDKLIKSILEYSTNGLCTNSMSLFSSADLIVEVLNMLDPYIQEKNARIYVDTPPFIYADRLQILQLFQNLIHNSLKFCSASVSPVIKIDAIQKDKFVEFQIQDNGIGIAKKYHKEIFLPFKKFHSRAEGSTYGIGLSLCQKIIENHGGLIKMSSQENVGTTFKFLLPSQTINE